MLPNLQYKPTNWVNGMKIRKDHFVNSENAFYDMVRDAVAMRLTNFNYGLLNPAPGDKKALELTVLRSQTDNFKISVSLCRAITAGGNRIEILPQVDEEVVCEDRIDFSVGNNKGKSSSNIYYAVITVDPFNRLPFGDATEETPARNPFTKPRYELRIIAEEDIDTGSLGAFHFPVARFISKAKEMVMDENYIPPCAVIQGHPALIQLYKNVGESLNKIQEHSTEIVQKVVAKSQNSPLAQNIRKLSESNAGYISYIFFKLRMVLTQYPPIFLLETVVQLANEIKLGLDFMPDKQREEVLNYFKNWNQVTPATFSEMLNEVIDLDYNHNNIYESFIPVINFLSMLSELFEKLSQLELLGMVKDKNLFIREMDVTDGKPAKKKGFNLLD